MWTGSKSFDTLVKSSRWNVEFFSDMAFTEPESAYPMLPIGSIVAERRESLEPQDYPDVMFNYLSLGHIATLTGDLVDFAPVLGSEVRSRSKVFKAGDVLYGRLRPYLNKVFLADVHSLSEGICSTEFFVLAPDSAKILPYLLRYLLASKFVVNYIERYQGGAALPRIHFSDFAEIKVPVPPMDFQLELVNFIAERNKQRRFLSNELAKLPHATMQSLTEALEIGRRIEIS